MQKPPYRLLFALLLVAIIAGCENEKDNPFAIAAGKIGHLDSSARIAHLDSIFAQDSLVRDTTKLELGANDKIEVYEKGGSHLLTLSPGGDSLKSIGNVRIRDARYLTPEGIGIKSTFGDIKKAYEIRKILSSLNNVVVLVKGSDAYFTISRESLPGALRYNNAPVEAVQIPDNAPIKYMMVSWD